MTTKECLKLICDGEIEIVRITEDLYDETVELYKNAFMKYENVAIACNLLESQEVVDEMEVLIRAILKDNISLAARDVKTKKLVGMCVSKILNPSAHITMDDVFDSFQTENMKSVGDFLQYVEYTYDIGKEWNVDCFIDLIFLATLPEYGRRGIGLSLVEYFVQYATKLKEGSEKEIKELPDHVREQRPKAITSVLTSLFSQKIMKKAKFEMIFQTEYSKFTFRGKTYAEKIDPLHKYTIFAAKKL